MNRAKPSVPRILFNISHGFQARMLLSTDIAKELIAEGAELIVVSPNVDEPYFRAEFDKPGYVLEPSPHRYGRLEKLLVSMRTYFLMNPALGGTYRHKSIRYRRRHPVRYWIARILNFVLGNVTWFRRAYLALESRIFDGSEYDRLLSRYRPDLVVAGTPGFNVSDAHLLRASKRSGLATCTVMLSWDNLTSKGYMGTQPDVLLVWNDLMRNEAIEYHDYSGRIIEVGAAHFDVYARARSTFDQRAFRSKNRIPADAKLIVWGTINSDIYPNQLELVRAFRDRVESKPDSRFLWIRLHPQTIHRAYSSLIDEYRGLEGQAVHVEFPPVQSQTLSWDLPGKEMEHLAHLMLAADLLITPQSTLTIDAACAETPVINLAIDPDFAGCIDYTHYRNVTKHEGVWVATEFDELLRAVDRYLEDPGLHGVGRAAIVSEQMGKWFGQAGKRTSEALLDLAIGRGADRGRTVRMTEHDDLRNLRRAVTLSQLSKARKMMKSPGRMGVSKLLELTTSKSNHSIELGAKLFWGDRMNVVFSEPVSMHIWRYGFHEVDVTSYLLNLLGPGMVFYDVGAHFGYFSLLASRLVGSEGEVHSFEPGREAVKILRSNASSHSNIRVVNAAAWSQNSILTLNDYGLMASALNSMRAARSKRIHTPESQYEVEALSLDDYAREHDAYPDFVKIDAESSEQEVLMGMAEIIQSSQPVISMEVGDYGPQDVPRSNQVLKLLTDSGYETYEAKSETLIRHDTRESYEYGNLLFVPKVRSPLPAELSHLATYPSL